ncbi:hypothetical protein C8R47DRAFT_1127243, partial [Mycena vitilis]
MRTSPPSAAFAGAVAVALRARRHPCASLGEGAEDAQAYLRPPWWTRALDNDEGILHKSTSFVVRRVIGGSKGGAEEHCTIRPCRRRRRRRCVSSALACGRSCPWGSGGGMSSGDETRTRRTTPCSRLEARGSCLRALSLAVPSVSHPDSAAEAWLCAVAGYARPRCCSCLH